MGEYVILKNKKAYFNYFILETFEAGLVLSGPEIKSIRAKNVSIDESFILIRKGIPEIINMNIKKYEFANNIYFDATRNRTLLLHKKQIKKIIQQVKLEKLTIVPLKLYLKGNFAKLEIGLAKGKKLYDKREVIKKRDVERKLQRFTKN
ncbi:SsrA-binding protein SmpB [Spiroplasma turonicum]|uniref:SsrA-binding protein n=1 Tax=Spiroplasma turonicum TaxID=216946 RepID=A0A0K1P578_9MOLU|nr:SsrA-binding protein SmpB [Spiroplasma turonicum]AKU79319.1 SsrA-binding protein [Spiroplasma turonicum]ALX70342.1 SsrA-binding protein [Spiroplasma turonicum]